MIVNEKFPLPGTEVGCEYRWPYSANHPDCWHPPHKGIVLALDDVRAWIGSIAFYHLGEPTQEEVTEHVLKCIERGSPFNNVPVLWEATLEPGKKFMQWDSKLRPYAEELAAWKAARAHAYVMENIRVEKRPHVETPTC